MYSLGIDIGYSSIKVTLIDEYNDTSYDKYILHKGKIKESINATLKEIIEKYDIEDIKYGAVTGSGSELLNKYGKIHVINEITSIIEGTIKTNKEVESIIELGGQNAKYITNFSGSNKSELQFSINSNCAAGTGAFLEEQIYRLDLKLEDYSKLTENATHIPRIAGRCSVFAKTDIIHHQQEGVSVEDILLGLSYSVIKNYKGIIMKKLPVKKPIVFIGGVANNRSVIRAIKDVLNLEDGDLIIPENFGNVAALGASLIAKKDEREINIRDLIEKLDKEDIKDSILTEDKSNLPRLISFGKDDSLNKHNIKILKEGKQIKCFLGIDVGSTSTNLVLIDEEKNVVDYSYLKTLGDPVEAVNKGLSLIKNKFGENIEIIGVGTTGSGRYMVGNLIGADVIKDEITAQGTATAHVDPEVDTIFEIGGQDSKFISCKDGIISDFEMNKICAAGTGSFIEEQAKKLDIKLDDLSELALKSKKPVNLGERCTVFIETNIATSLAGGEKIEDIVSGLCYSIVKNYLNRVVGNKKIGEKIFLQGGVAYNQGIINAFRQVLGKEVQVSQYFSVTGAFGVAILTSEEMKGKATKFRGFKISKEDFKIEEKVKNQDDKDIDMFEEIEKLYIKNYDGTTEDCKKTIGIPRVLFLHKLFPMFNIFFKTLGFNVILSKPTDEEIIKQSQEYSLDETCYPIKLINGHVKQLLDKEVDYIFLPSLHTMKHETSKSRQDYGCAYMQQAPKIINQTMGLEELGIKLLSPELSFKFGKKYMMKTLIGVGKELGKGTLETARSLQKGMKELKSFEKAVEKIGKEEVDKLKQGEKAFVIITRAYGIADPVLNMGIAKKIRDMGYKVLTLSNLPAHDLDISNDHPNMYWPFGQHILAGAEIIKNEPNLYPIYLTNHGCGPDTVLAHYFKEQIGEKPYLGIEVDEHSSNVGVATRIEAFINSINKEVIIEKTVDNLERTNIYTDISNHESQEKLYIPHMYPYSNIFKEILKLKRIDAQVLDITDEKSINIGREFMISKEYFSLTALLGDVFKKVKQVNKEENISFLIPQTEGTEVYGQYSRLLKAKLDEGLSKNTNIISPFIEDLIMGDREETESIFLTLIAGDLIMNAPRKNRDNYLKEIIEMIRNRELNIENLKAIGKKIYKELKITNHKKKILVVGETSIIFNDYLNNFTFKEIEENHKIVYQPMSEFMYFIWHDFIVNNKSKQFNNKKIEITEKLNAFNNYIKVVSQTLLEESPFESDIKNIIETADRNLKNYTAGNGRYIKSKTLGSIEGIDGIITTSSMYENNNTILNIIKADIQDEKLKPTLNLNFDGNKNKSDEMKVESFIYYI